MIKSKIMHNQGVPRFQKTKDFVRRSGEPQNARPVLARLGPFSTMGTLSADVANLIRLTLGGDPAAANQLFGDLRHWLRSQKLDQVDNLLRIFADESDLTNQTLLEVHRDLGSFRDRSSDAAFRKWTVTIRNHVVDKALRHLLSCRRDIRKRRSLHLGDDLRMPSMTDPKQETPSQTAMRRETQSLVDTAMNALPPDQRIAVILRHKEGWSIAEISALLEKSEASVGGLLKRGLRILRTAMKDTHA